jgi:hypothetical protein
MELEQNGILPFLYVLAKKKTDGTLGHTIYRKTTHTDLYLTCGLRTSSGTNKDLSHLSSIAYAPFIINIVYRMKFNSYIKPSKQSIYLLGHPVRSTRMKQAAHSLSKT